MMDDIYPYPVFFECDSPIMEQSKRIENYFSIRRKSRGGVCGRLRTAGDKVFSISFKDQKVQQQVLQQCEHVVELADGPLVITVRGSLDPHTPTPSQDLTAPQQSISASTPPPSGEEYELQPDNYLLQYLKECPEAGAELEGELASVSCSAQLYPEEGRVLVKCLSQPAAVDEGNNWKAEVDKLFGAYLCHYEVDPYKVKALLQSCSSPQTTDEVKVYSEGGLAVVVGKHSQVNDRLNFVDSTANNQGSRVLQRKTRICRLGEAKLRLLWKEIEHGLGIYFPGVKVTQGDAGQVVLEGFVEDVLEAGDWVSDKENLILERTVSKMSPYLLVFLRKAYGGPGVLGDFLGVGDKVEIELRDTELHVFSFFADTLDDAEKKLQREFNELKIDVPNCSAVPSDLCEKLKSKVNEMNQVQYRAQVLFVLDNTVSLLGHAKEVEELSEAVTQFILDHSCIEGKVVLRFPELVQHLPQLLQLHKFDYSGVTIHPLTSSSQPTVLLEGPFSKVTEVRNRLGPFLDSLVQGTVTISLPGATRYFESPSGRENILSVAHSQKCLIELQEQPHTAIWNSASGARLSNGGRLGASYSLCDGLEVLVCQGDITKQDADALVNAANEDLDHCGGVAAALSKAGGPEIQRESSALVKQIRKIPTGDVVLTTGGNLPCKKLLHAVGPVAGRADGKERFLLEKTVQSTLNLSEMMEFKSIAMPCISSGVFGVPVTVCAEAIVSAVKKFGSQGGRSLSRIILIDNRAEVVKAMQEACDRLLQGISSVNTTPSEPRGAPAGAPGDGVHVEVVQGTINTEQVDALVSPMAGHDPLSTRVGNILSSMVGPELKTKFYKDAGGASLPGDIVLVEGLWALQFKAVIFINLLPWDNHQNGTAVQVLRQGLRKVLASCEIRGFSSVALPVIGTGAVLRFPHNVAARVLLEEVSIFEQNRMNASSFRVRVVVHPKDKESGKAFQSAQDTLHFRGFTNDVIPDQASFYRYVSVSTDEVTAMLGRVKLQMVHGDIVNEGTDIIVNTTDFSNNQSGVSKAILTAAGHGVQAQLAQVGLPTDYMCTTGAGLLGCKEIIHASFSCDPQLFRKNCKKIVKQCESKGYHSIAFPAINTGVAGMDSVKACKAILDGIAFAIRDLKPNSLSLIRIVILQQPVFQAFRSELENRFGQTVPPHLNLKEKAKQKLKEWEVKYSKTTISAPQDNTFIFSKPQPAVISVICRGSDIIETIKSNLEQILQKQLIDRVVNVSDFSRLDAMQLEAVLAKVRVSGISVERRKRESVKGNRVGSTARAGATDRSGEEDFILSGLKEDILSIIELVNTAVHKGLCQDLQEKKEAMLAHVVQWLIQDIDGTWQKLSLRDNYVLETGHLGNQVSVTAPCGMMVRVNLQLQEATNWKTQVTYKVKRTETGATLKLPTQWEPMHNKVFKRVKLQPNTKEYQDVAQGFHKTAAYNIQKIERVQNLYLWHAYTVCKQRIVAKNGEAELGEKTLYHGTSVESCDCIERDRFDRNFAGKHAALYGKGVYFAVNANYSASRYAKADASGLKRLYVARVLTGRFTVGNSTMKTPPPRGTDPTDCFDSLVDNQQQPSMFVIFHDDQAYPEYLITFY